MSRLADYPLVIREAHVDSLGHMNNATYLALFEEARWENITRAGYGFSEIQKLRKGPVILEVNLKFLRELHLRESIVIRSEVLDYAGKIGHMKQRMIKADGTVAAEAVFTFGLFDLQTRRLIEPTPEWLAAVGLKP
ncbi:MAG: acyl-CoA thioesterase [Bdellovibrionaceae bacterium]|nr:acyl-CoA thioesterase [Pseudobdellovibrionaceae bacterium]